MNAVTESAATAQARSGKALSSNIAERGAIFVPLIIGLIIDTIGSYTQGWLNLSILMVIVYSYSFLQ